MKYIAATANGQNSAIKATRKEVDDWAKNTLSSSKSTTVYIFEAVTTFSVAPREIIETPIENLPIPAVSTGSRSNGYDIPQPTEDPDYPAF